MKNVCCRIFKEQLDLVLALPESERAEVLYKSILSAFNQFENQFENQFDNQNENAYVSVSVSVSVSESVSDIGKKIFNLLEKNIVCKNFSNNYGGKRIRAGRKKQIIESEPIKKNNNPTLDDILSFAREQSAFSGCGGINIPDDIATRFFERYNAQDWRDDNNTPIRDWKKLLIGWAKNAPKYKNTDIDDFLDSWNNHFVKSVKSVSQWAKADTATIDDVRALIPTAKQKLLAVIKTAQEKQKRGERPIIPFKPTSNIWDLAVAVLLKRRFYSDFLYNDCNITAKFFCNHITELADPYSTEYLNESEKHTHD